LKEFPKKGSPQAAEEEPFVSQIENNHSKYDPCSNLHHPVVNPTRVMELSSIGAPRSPEQNNEEVKES
jgi:hypothetical protein